MKRKKQKKHLPIGKILCEECTIAMRHMPKNSIDAIVTDPPAGIAFMGKDWDRDKGGRDSWIAWMEKVAVECLRILKPGGHALVWSIPRTAHWTATAWENAGFEVRDKIYHCFSSGFPKSLNVGKAIDKNKGAERKVIGRRKHPTLKNTNLLDEKANASHGENEWSREWDITAPATDSAKQWEGWGTALKPAIEEWHVFRKPLDGTVAANIQKWGTGALNIDGCRVATKEITGRPCYESKGWKNTSGMTGSQSDDWKKGRWPANLCHDGSKEVLKLFPQIKSTPFKMKRNNDPEKNIQFMVSQKRMPNGGYADSGSAARFFYCAKTSRRERESGLQVHVPCTICGKTNTHRHKNDKGHWVKCTRNVHPTVKPLSLMKYLCKLVTPPNGIILDPFCGSGSTLVAACRGKFRYIGIDKDRTYCTIAEQRVQSEQMKRPYILNNV